MRCAYGPSVQYPSSTQPRHSPERSSSHFATVVSTGTHRIRTASGITQIISLTSPFLLFTLRLTLPPLISLLLSAFFFTRCLRATGLVLGHDVLTGTDCV